MLRSGVCLLTLTVVLAGSMHGQVVRGTARDAQNDHAIESGVITLLDAGGATVRAVLTDSLGEFAVLAPAVGTYRLRFERLGYRPITSDRFTLGRGESTTRTLRPTAVSVSLAEIVVRDRPRCRILGEADTLTARVWTAVRSVLASAAAGEAGVHPHVTIERYERDYDLRNQLLQERKWTKSGASSSPFVALAASELEKQGFAKRSGDSVIFYAPDARTLIAEEFLRTHCFRIRDERAQRARIGLDIEPVPGRSLPEIKGTLWVDAASGELRRLEFVYVNMPSIVPPETSEGWVEFRRLPRGAWVVDRWALRLPLVGEQPAAAPYGGPPIAGGMPPARGAALLGVHEEGGRIVSLDAQRGPGRNRPTATVAVRGHVRTPSGEPVPGARAFLSGTGHSSVTDREGSFTMRDVAPATYRLSFTHPRFDTLGIVGEVIELDAGNPGELVLTMPTDEEIARAACGSEESSPSGGGPTLVYGYVRDGATPAIVVGATVIIAWRNAAPRGPAVGVRTLSLEADSDVEGRYQLCGVPRDVQLTVRVTREMGRGSELSVEPLRSSVTRLDVSLPRGRSQGR